MRVTLICPNCKAYSKWDYAGTPVVATCPECRRIMEVSGDTFIALPLGDLKPSRLWPILSLILTVLAALFLGLYVHKTKQYSQLRQPIILQTNLFETNLMTSIEVITNVIVTNLVTNVVQAAVGSDLLTNLDSIVITGPKVMVKGYEIVRLNGLKYAHALVQNLTPNTLASVRIEFNGYGLNKRRAKYFIGSGAETFDNLGPYQTWEMRKSIDSRIVQLELVGVTATD